MTQKQRIINALKKGQKLTTLTAAMKGMGTKLNTRLGELEYEFKWKLTREWKEDKKRNMRWIEYSLPNKYR